MCPSIDDRGRPGRGRAGALRQGRGLGAEADPQARGQGRGAAWRGGRGDRHPARGASADALGLAACCAAWRTASPRDRINAEAAVQAEISAVAQEFAALDDAYLAARADDVREVGDRLIRNLTKTPFAAFSHLPEGTIIVAEDLTPADTALMDPAIIAGFATFLGGAESHTAIMARSLGLPAVLGVAGLLGVIKNGDPLIIDGDEGRVVVRPVGRDDCRIPPPPGRPSARSALAVAAAPPARR